MRGLIETYDSITGRGTFQLLSDYRISFQILYKRVGAAVWVLTMGKWYKKRTTGWKSQGNHINGHVQQICMDTGQDFETVKMMVKYQAVSAGFPFETYQGHIIPKSEALCDTVEAALLIEAAHVIAADLGIILREDDE